MLIFLDDLPNASLTAGNSSEISIEMQSRNATSQLPARNGEDWCEVTEYHIHNSLRARISMTLALSEASLHIDNIEAGSNDVMQLKFLYNLQSTSNMITSSATVDKQTNKASNYGSVSAITNNSVEILGLVGLNNMGNTCFLSAALQCLMRTPILSVYFLTNQYQGHINKSNPLGTKGKLVHEYASFLHTIFVANAVAQSSSSRSRSSNSPSKPSLFNKKSNTSNSGISPGTKKYNTVECGSSYSGETQYGATVYPTNYSGAYSSSVTNVKGIVVTNNPKKYNTFSPTSFIKMFQHFKPQFTGQDQQDSQEFLNELLDAFHEDLKSNNINSIVAYNYNRRNSECKQIASSPTDIGMDLSDVGGREAERTAPSNITAEKNDSENQSGHGTVSVVDMGNTAWKNYLSSNHSIISSLMQGQLCNRVICNECKNASTNFEPFTSLSLSIPKLTQAAVAASNGTDITEVNNLNNEGIVKTAVFIYRRMPRFGQIVRALRSESKQVPSEEQIDLLSIYYR